MIDLIFSISKNEKKYIQIYNKLKNDIIEKKISPNEKLPSKRIFAKSLGVSINSITYAYDILIEEGYIYSIEKKGYYVNSLDFNLKSPKKNTKIKKEITSLYKYDLTTSYINENDLYKKTLNKIIRETINNKNYFKRSSFSGSAALKEAIAKMLYSEKNINVNPNQIIISNGSNTLIKKILYLLGEKSIAVEYPGYYNTEMLGVKCEYVNTDSKGFSTTFKDAKSKIGIVTSFSQYPLGIKMPIDRKLELIKILEKKDKILIEDSFDSDFRNNGYYTNPLFNLSDKVIYMESFSKTIYPGLCISFMVLPIWLIDKYSETFKTDSCISSLDQLLLMEYINNEYYTRHINRLRTLFLKKKQLILNSLNKDIFKVYSNLNYSSILVKIKKKININKIKKEINSNKIKINFLNDFYFKDQIDPILIIGFSNINTNDLLKALNILTKIILS